MLVLTRKRDQKIMIGDDIVITVVEVTGDKVRLGVTAPPEIHIVRDDIKNAEPRARGVPTLPAEPPAIP